MTEVSYILLEYADIFVEDGELGCMEKSSTTFDTGDARPILTAHPQVSCVPERKAEGPS